MSTSRSGVARWAREQFGRTGGHAATAARWVRMATAAAQHPAGTVTATFRTPAEQKAAYRQLENDALTPAAVLDGPATATARAARAHPYVLVPVDGTSATITDPAHAKGTGPVGVRRLPTRGYQLATAIALDPHGVPLGLADLRLWARPERPRKVHRHKRRLRDKETAKYLATCEAIRVHFATHAPATRPWFQVDRGLDVHHLLDWAVRRDVWLTVRAQHDRRVRNAPADRLWAALAAQPIRHVVVVAVPATARRAARRAVLEVRAAQVELVLQDRRTHRRYTRRVGAVLAREVSDPGGAERLEWLLVTTHPLDTAEDVERVLRSYALRWRVEDFHKAWKSAVCGVEASQLRSAHAFAKWATLLAAVAVRAERLTHLSRTTPEAEASTEFDREEIDAVILLRQPRGWRPGDAPTLGQLVRWIADLGGYTGKSSGGPPGKIVITRGLLDVEAVARALKAQRKLGSREGT